MAGAQVILDGWSTSNFGPGAKVILDGWSRSLEFGFLINRQFIGQARCTNKTVVFYFLLDQIVLEPEPKNLDGWSWKPKFEFRLHTPETNTHPRETFRETS